MPWKEVSIMSLRYELVSLAMQEGINMRALCRGFGISPKTGYKWLHRFRQHGPAGLAARSRRPHRSPRRTAASVEAAVLGVRAPHPEWGGRKIRRRLQDLGFVGLPAPSTITALLHRHGRIDPEAARQRAPFTRFEHKVPNALWQMDFKGHVAMVHGRCHPLTLLDDHARFNLALRACADERGLTVKDGLTMTFRRYGLPARLLIDNGAPWGDDAAHSLTPLTVWLIHLGVAISHSRPYHPQTLGKLERFHRTLKAEVLGDRVFADLAAAQRHFDRWRDVYNLQRPHEALDLAVPASRYHPSPRAFPETLPSIEYGPGERVRTVQAKGELYYKGRVYRIAKALRGYAVALRPTPTDGVLSVHFCQTQVAEIDLRNPDQ